MHVSAPYSHLKFDVNDQDQVQTKLKSRSFAATASREPKIDSIGNRAARSMPGSKVFEDTSNTRDPSPQRKKSDSSIFSV